MQARYTDYKILLTINKYQTYVEFETTFFFKFKNRTKFSSSDSVIFDFGWLSKDYNLLIRPSFVVPL